MSTYWQTFQQNLFLWLGEKLGPLSERRKRLVQVREVVRVEDWMRGSTGQPVLSDAARLLREAFAGAAAQPGNPARSRPSWAAPTGILPKHQERLGERLRLT